MRNILLLIILFFSISTAQSFTELGRFGGKGSENGMFNNPLAIAISKEKIVYVVDSGNNRIQLFDLKGSFLKSIGGFGFNDDQFDAPRDIWVTSLINIYVADYNNRRLQRYDRNMNFINSLYSNEGDETDFQFSEVASCAVNSQNDLFVVDHEDYKIVKFKRDGNAERVFGLFDSGSGELDAPEQIDFWGFDKIAICDPGNVSLVIFDLFGNFISRIKYEDFRQPRGIEIGPNKNIFVSDPQAKKIFMINQDLKNIKKIQFPYRLKSPQDIAVIKIEDQILLFVIDQNEVIIGNLQVK